MKEVIMPASGIAMTEGLLRQWLREPGDTVAAGEPIAEIETDKATVELESPASGRLGRHLVTADEQVPVGTILVWILEAGENEPAAAATTVAQPEPAAVASRAVTEVADRAPHRLSPRARREAREATAGQGQVTPQPADGYRPLIAAKVSQSWREIPHFAVTREISAEAVLAARARLSSTIPELTLTDLFLRALGIAVSQTVAPPVNLGLAVATPRGVVVTVVTDVLGSDLGTLTRRRADVVAGAMGGSLSAADMEPPAIATLSNLGAFGVDQFTGIIFPGQSMLLTIGKVRPRVVVDGHQPAVRSTFFATLNVDHQAIDGADAARTLGAFAEAVESGGTMAGQETRND